MKLGKWVLYSAWVVGLLIGSVLTAWAQTDTTLKTPVQGAAERGERKLLRQQALKAGAIDSLMALRINTLSIQATRRDSIFYTRLKTRLYKHRLTRQLYDAVFQDMWYCRGKQVLRYDFFNIFDSSKGQLRYGGLILCSPASRDYFFVTLIWLAS